MERGTRTAAARDALRIPRRSTNGFRSVSLRAAVVVVHVHDVADVHVHDVADVHVHDVADVHVHVVAAQVAAARAGRRSLPVEDRRWRFFYEHRATRGLRSRMDADPLELALRVLNDLKAEETRGTAAPSRVHEVRRHVVELLEEHTRARPGPRRSDAAPLLVLVRKGGELSARDIAHALGRSWTTHEVCQSLRRVGAVEVVARKRGRRVWSVPGLPLAQPLAA